MILHAAVAAASMWAATAAAVGQWRTVTSMSGTFEYKIPVDWSKDAENSYRGKIANSLEEVYPPAEISEDYCRSFRTPVSTQEYEKRNVANRLYDNGHVRGCYTGTSILNTQLKRKWFHATFRFATPRGIESVTIVMPDEEVRSVPFKTIIDSIRTK